MIQYKIELQELVTKKDFVDAFQTLSDRITWLDENQQQFVKLKEFDRLFNYIDRKVITLKKYGRTKPNSGRKHSRARKSN